MPRWGGDSGLSISRDLTKYSATVRASLASPFTVTLQGHLGTMVTIDYNWNLVADVP